MWPVELGNARILTDFAQKFPIHYFRVLVLKEAEIA